MPSSLHVQLCQALSTPAAVPLQLPPRRRSPLLSTTAASTAAARSCRLLRLQGPFCGRLPRPFLAGAPMESEKQAAPRGMATCAEVQGELGGSCLAGATHASAMPAGAGFLLLPRRSGVWALVGLMAGHLSPKSPGPTYCAALTLPIRRLPLALVDAMPPIGELSLGDKQPSRPSRPSAHDGPMYSTPPSEAWRAGHSGAERKTGLDPSPPAVDGSSASAGGYPTGHIGVSDEQGESAGRGAASGE